MHMSFTVMLKVGKLEVVPTATGLLPRRVKTKEYQKLRSVTTHKPESKPPEMGAQGLANVDWVTLWFLGLNVNWTVSPTDAFWTEGCQYDGLAEQSALD